MKTRNKMYDLKVLEVGNSDSEPDEIGFNVGRAEATQALKDIAVGIKLQKDAKKQKRTKLHERNAVQKRNKLARVKELVQRRLPEDFLEKISAIPDKTPNRVSNEKSERTRPDCDDKDSKSDHDSEDDNDVPSTHEASEDFISIHGSTQFRVAVLPKELKKPLLSASAAEFRQKMLYRKEIPRETVKKMLSRNQKQALKGGLSFM